MKYKNINKIILCLLGGLVILTGCQNISSNIPKKIDDKEVVVISRLRAEWANRLPENSQELAEDSDLIATGTVIDSQAKSNGSQTGITYKITKLYKGKVENSTVLVWYDGCYIPGEEYVLKNPDAEAGFTKGVDTTSEQEAAKEKALKELSGKMVGLGLVDGQIIPEIGKEYLFFAWSVPESPDFGGTGHEYSQGLFLVRDGKIMDFDPIARKASVRSKTINVDDFLKKAIDTK